MSSHIWVSLNPVTCDSKSIILFSRLLISVSMDFFLLLPYFIDSPLTAIFMTSHRTWGFASWFISFMVFIVFLIKSTYSFSLRWLQFIFQKPFPLLVSNGMRSIIVYVCYFENFLSLTKSTPAIFSDVNDIYSMYKHCIARYIKYCCQSIFHFFNQLHIDVLFFTTSRFDLSNLYSTWY